MEIPQRFCKEHKEFLPGKKYLQHLAFLFKLHINMCLCKHCFKDASHFKNDNLSFISSLIIKKNGRKSMISKGKINLTILIR
jgi:hypothetical protein